MYADYFLKFSNQAEAEAVLFTGDGEDRRPVFQNVDVIGELVRKDGTPYEGYHANVRLVLGAESPDAFAGYEVFPAAPRRVWAGPMYPVTLED